MDVISVWQPWASLIIHNHKFNETRGWPAPKNLIGTTIGIASTKMIRPEQRVAFLDPNFQHHYRPTRMPSIEELPCGYLLGTALLHSCEAWSEELESDTTDEEIAFGVYGPGRYIWRLRNPRPLTTPIPVRGAQGVWKYDPHAQITPLLRYADQEGSAQIRRDLHAAERDEGLPRLS